MRSLKIADEYETVRAIIRHRASIARYGDGELRLCLGRHQMSQRWTPEIGRRLREILIEENPLLLVGIPRIDGRTDWPRPEKGVYWARWNTKPIRQLYNPARDYFSAFITRPDSGTGLYQPEYWDLIRQIWAGRRVTLLKGEGTGFDKQPSLFELADGPPTVILGPATQAFQKHDRLLSRMLREPVDNVLVISLGPTATVLAADLAREGRQALDLGHLGMFYAGIHPKYDPAAANPKSVDRAAA